MRKFLRLIAALTLIVTSSASAAPHKTWQYSIALGSCTDDPASPIWGSIKAAKPDAFLMLGDNIYLRDDEWREPGKVDARYEALAENADFAALRKSVPLFGVVDDHDFGPNNADSKFEFKKNTLTAFKKMFRSNPPPPQGLEDSIAFEKRIGHVLMLVTDNRSFRINSTETSQGVMFGERQLGWLEKRLANPDAEVIVIAAGNEFLPEQGGSQTFFPYRAERERLWKAIAESDVPVVLLSGDRHYGQIMLGRIGDKSVMEISSSPLTAAPRKNTTKIEFNREIQNVITVGGLNNFGLLTISRESQGAISARAELRLADGMVSAARSLSWTPR